VDIAAASIPAVSRPMNPAGSRLARAMGMARSCRLESAEPVSGRKISRRAGCPATYARPTMPQK